jgi:thymidylate synthase (FAD)
LLNIGDLILRLIRESVEVFSLDGKLTSKSEEVIGKLLESCGRVCYKSEPKITDDSYKKFLKTIIKSGHESILEHASVTAKIITNRAVSLETVRHRLNSFSQESTRYCNYSGDRFGNELTFIVPVWISDEEVSKFHVEDSISSNPAISLNPSFTWWFAMHQVEEAYFSLLNRGWTPEKAREILPNSLKTELVMTANVRQWRHVLQQRLSPKCHPQMRFMMFQLAEKFNEYLPLFFNDIFSSVAMSITGEQTVFVNDAIKIIEEDILGNKNDK